MSAMQAQPSKGPSPLAEKVQALKGQLDNLILKMEKNQKFTPTREELEKQAEQLIYFLNKYHDKTMTYASHIKAAIIDLSEVPDMAPQMQRIAFLTALKDASQELSAYLSYT